MNLDALKETYRSDPRIFQIADRLSFSKTQHISLHGLAGSSTAFVVAAVFEHELGSTFNHMIVLEDAEEAAYFHNSLEHITGALDLFYFPSSFKNKKNFRLLNGSHVMLRTEALTHIAAGGNKKIIVTYPEALFEKVVVSKTLAQNIITIKQAETLNLESVIELLVMLNFKRTDFVYEPGQFAIRGGIFDIYSFGNEKPYRIELFGNEVDSIRVFDAETQLSERRLLSVNIIPNVDTQFQEEEKTSLLEFLPENTVIWYNDFQFIKEKLELEEESLHVFLEFLKDNPALTSVDDVEPEDRPLVKEQLSKEEFVTASVFEGLLVQKHQVSLHGSFANGPAEATVIPFNTKPQPSFNRNFTLLIADLKGWEKKGYALYLFAEQAKQLERLYNIFTDLQTEISFTPVAAGIHEGYIDEDLKLVCYTDHQIFQRYHKFKVKACFTLNL